MNFLLEFFILFYAYMFLMIYNIIASRKHVLYKILGVSRKKIVHLILDMFLNI